MSTISGETKKISELPSAQNLVPNDMLVVEREVGGTEKMKYGEMLQKVTEDVINSEEVSAMSQTIEGHTQQIGSLAQSQTQMGEALNELSEDVTEVSETVATHTQSINELGTGKEDKATDPDELGEGYLYKDAEGNVILVEGGGGGGGSHFKYGIVFDNGADGTPSNVTYIGDCAGFTPAVGSNLGSWAGTKLLTEYFRPCVIGPEDTEPKYYLNPAVLTQKMDGTSAVLTGADGDVMVQVKKLYGKFVNNGTSITAYISDQKEDDTWFCWTEMNGIEQEYAYRGRYMAGVASGAGTVMRSISGVSKLVNITRANGRTYATNRGAKYHQNNVYLLFLWQFMYLLMYKNRNSQTALGQGRTASSNTSNVATGWSNNYGCCWGDQGGVNGCVFLWVEDFYGDTWEWVDGLCLVNKTYMLTKYPSRYNDTGSNYEISVASGLTAANNNNKYVSKMTGTNAIPFLPAATGGSDSTYYCDNFWMADSVQVASFGGAWNAAAKAGAFYWALAYAASSADASIGSRLCRAA